MNTAKFYHNMPPRRPPANGGIVTDSDNSDSDEKGEFKTASLQDPCTEPGKIESETPKVHPKFKGGRSCISMM